jgi:hypothetical protein
MVKTKWLNNIILLNGSVLVGVAIPHLIDDFLYGIPEEFGLTNVDAQVLSGLFSALLVWTFTQVGRENRAGFISAGFLGIFLALAGILKHVPLMIKPGPYWGGLFSETLIIALILSGLSLFSLSLYALRIVMIGNAEEVHNVQS